MWILRDLVIMTWARNVHFMLHLLGVGSDIMTFPLMRCLSKMENWAMYIQSYAVQN